jgi:hypothetical protein
MSDQEEEPKKERVGAFVKSLKRNNKEIKSARAEAICDIAQMKYTRAVEDMQMQLKDMVRQQDSSLDMSPTTTDSLVMAQDFKSDEYVADDIKLATDIRNLNIKLEVAKKRCTYLFGAND